MTPGRVLVLDGETIQALACVRSLGRFGHAVWVASRRRRPLAAWSKFSRGHFRLEAETIAGFAELRHWARTQGVTAVLPVTERSCLLCNAERVQWEEAGITVGCGPADMLLRAFDKGRTLEHAARAGIRIPLTRTAKSAAECRAAGEVVGFPCVVKPRFSNAWDGTAFRAGGRTTYVGTADELEAAVAANVQGEHGPLIQAFVPGRGKGVFTVCDRGRVVAWFAHERLRDIRPSGSGSSLRRAAPLDPRLRVPTEQLLSEMQWHGPAMVEFRDDGQSTPWLIEVNGRFWGSLQLAVTAGVDFPLLWLAMLSGEPMAATPRYEVGVTLRWLWGDVKRLLYIVAGRPPGYPGPYPSLIQGIREVFGPQPRGTRLETWDRRDPWPALGEWVQGASDLVAITLGQRAGQTRAASRSRVASQPSRSPGPPTPGRRPVEEHG